MGKFTKRVIRSVKGFAKRLLSQAQEQFNASVQGGEYDLEILIADHDWRRNGGSRKASQWFSKMYKDPKNKYLITDEYMESGKLYTFKYPNPKHKDTLEWYDTNPLVLCLGHYKNKSGDIYEMGINLHHLPQKIREQVLITVFNMYSKKYKGQMYRTDAKKINMEWKKLAIPLVKYGAEFAFRSYIPRRRIGGSFEFPYEEFHNAIFVPSEKYKKMTESQIYDRWKEHLMTKSLKKLSTNQLADALGRFQL